LRTRRDIVIHLAARAHVMREAAPDALAQYRHVNVQGTERLLQQAAQAGVRRCVYLSSIKVNGEARESPGFNESDAPHPADAYGISKREAEQCLESVCARSGIERVVLRPPLIYGPGVKGNLRALLKAVDRGIPLPLGGIENRRSLVGIDNLIAAIRLCAQHPAAAGETFLVADDAPVSSPQLIRTIAWALGRPVHLFSVPTRLLTLVGRLTGRSAAMARLTSSLVVDSSKIRRMLGWQCVSSFEQGAYAMAAGYRSERS
jgi:nucleoside-diphosphate-sugar epimerase